MIQPSACTPKLQEIVHTQQVFGVCGQSKYMRYVFAVDNSIRCGESPWVRPVRLLAHVDGSYLGRGMPWIQINN